MVKTKAIAGQYSALLVKFRLVLDSFLILFIFSPLNIVDTYFL